MDKLQWFKFSPTDWIMGKIQRCPEITQARFMRLICLYWNKECVLSYEDAEIEIDKEHLDILILKKIIKIEDNLLIIEFLNEQLGSISETSEKRREAVLKRWAKVKQNDTSVLQVNTSVLQSDTEKSRVEKIREDNKTTTAITYSIEKAIEICLRDLEWINATSENCNLDKDKFQYALNDFKKNCISIGRNEDRTLFEFKSHFVNWVKIKKTLKAKETVKDRL
jgi:hypothetical protein